MSRKLTGARWLSRGGIAAGLVLGLNACAPATERLRPAPTGRYEGTLTYRGAELPVVVSLYQDSASRAVQVLLHAPQAPLYSRLFDSVAYQAPTLMARLPGGSRLALREEPNFLTGAVWLHDTLRAELVAVRRAEADLPPYTAVRQRPSGGLPAAWRFVPLDTVPQHPAVLLWAVPGAHGWADWLARLGNVVTVVSPPAAQPDSVTREQLAAAFQQLRDYGAAGVDTGRVVVWAAGPGGRAALLARVGGLPAAGLLLQGVPFVPADQSWLRLRRPLRLPVLGLYGGRDTTFAVSQSSQVLRRALAGWPGSGVKVYNQAGAALLVSAPADSAGRWPQLPPDLAAGLQQWLGGLPAQR